MGPIPEGARHAPATRRERAAALAAPACAEDGDALGPCGWKPAAGDPTAGERARHPPDQRAGGLRTTARGRLHRRPRRLRQLTRGPTAHYSPVAGTTPGPRLAP